MTYQEAYEKGYVEPAHLQSAAYFKNSWGTGVINDDWFKKINYIALREITLSYKRSNQNLQLYRCKELIP